MPKIPDFSKFDLQGIVNTLKSVLSSTPSTPTVTPGDPVGEKIVEISTLIQSVVKGQTQCAKDLSRINDLLNNLYQDVERFRKPPVEPTAPGTAKTETHHKPEAHHKPTEHVDIKKTSEGVTKTTIDEETKKKGGSE